MSLVCKVIIPALITYHRSNTSLNFFLLLFHQRFLYFFSFSEVTMMKVTVEIGDLIAFLVLIQYVHVDIYGTVGSWFPCW